MEPHLPAEGRFLDLGCGNGLFAAILKLGSPARKVAGFDLDEGKVELARKTFEGWEGMDFWKGDVVASEYPSADVVTIIDVLYLIPFEAQEAILRKCHAALPAGGLLAFKEMDDRPRWKALWNRLQETLAVKIIGFTLGSKFYFAGQAGVRAPARADRFRRRSRAPAQGLLVPAHSLFGRKKINRPLSPRLSGDLLSFGDR